MHSNFKSNTNEFVVNCVGIELKREFDIDARIDTLLKKKIFERKERKINSNKEKIKRVN